MDYIKEIDESICDLNLESRIEEAKNLDQTNRKQYRDESNQIIYKLKESLENNILPSDTPKKYNNNNMWSAASDYIDYAHSVNPNILDNCGRMVNVIRKKGKVQETTKNN